MIQEQQMLSDKLAIQELNYRYFWAVDSNDEDAYISTWMSDGISEAVYGSVNGHDQLRARFRNMQAGLSKNKRHFVGNLVITIEGNKAQQQCYLLVVERADEPAVISTAVYHDELERIATGWKFSKRSIQIDPSWKQ